MSQDVKKNIPFVVLNLKPYHSITYTELQLAQMKRHFYNMLVMFRALFVDGESVPVSKMIVMFNSVSQKSMELESIQWQELTNAPFGL